MKFSDDYGFTARQLDDKYNQEGDGEHPGYTRKDWRQAVDQRDTVTGYWDWVRYQLAEEETESAEGASRCEELLRSIDWTLLREQKTYCVNEANNRPEVGEIYGGIVQLFNELQDAAVESGIATEGEVFGKDGA